MESADIQKTIYEIIQHLAFLPSFFPSLLPSCLPYLPPSSLLPPHYLPPSYLSMSFISFLPSEAQQPLLAEALLGQSGAVLRLPFIRCSLSWFYKSIVLGGPLVVVPPACVPDVWVFGNAVPVISSSKTWLHRATTDAKLIAPVTIPPSF